MLIENIEQTTQSIFFKNLLDQSKDSHFILDPKTEYFIYANHRFSEEFQYSKDQLRKVKFSDIYKSFDLSSLWEEWVEKVKKIGSFLSHGSIRKLDGEDTPVELESQWVEKEKENYLLVTIQKNSDHQKSYTDLNGKGITLKEILEFIEVEKANIQEKIVGNIDCLLAPILIKLKDHIEPEGKKYFDLLENNLSNMSASFGHKIGRRSLGLTLMEIEVCSLIKNGLRTKDIAQFLNISPLTVETHRNRIRKKLKINNQNVNLVTYLQSL